MKISSPVKIQSLSPHIRSLNNELNQGGYSSLVQVSVMLSPFPFQSRICGQNVFSALNLHIILV